MSNIPPLPEPPPPSVEGDPGGSMGPELVLGIGLFVLFVLFLVLTK